MTTNSFGARAQLRVGERAYRIYRLGALAKAGFDVARLPYSLKILLENLLRLEDGVAVRPGDIEALARWEPRAEPSHEIAFMPARVLLQDFTGVPAVVDLAAMRDAMQALGGDPKKINPLLPAELVIDHSVQVDAFGTPSAFQVNADLEFERNRERYAFLRWGQRAFRNFRVVPPDTGIVHQVNLEYLARVVFSTEDKEPLAYPDTLVGTDSHTTMVNGLGVLGWGVGGIEAEAAMLGQPTTMLIPQVIGFKLTGRLARGRDRDRPGAHGDRDAPEEGRGREVRGVLRARRVHAADRGPRDDRQHGAGVRRDLRHLPRGRGDAALPPLHRAAGVADRAGRGVRQGAGAVPRPARRPSRSSATRSSSISAASSRASPGPSARRTGSRLKSAKQASRPRRCRSWSPAASAATARRRRVAVRRRRVRRSGTAPSSSRRSPAAPTPPTRR